MKAFSFQKSAVFKTLALLLAHFVDPLSYGLPQTQTIDQGWSLYGFSGEPGSLALVDKALLETASQKRTLKLGVEILGRDLTSARSYFDTSQDPPLFLGRQARLESLLDQACQTLGKSKAPTATLDRADIRRLLGQTQIKEESGKDSLPWHHLVSAGASISLLGSEPKPSGEPRMIVATGSCFDPPGRRFEFAQHRAEDAFGILAVAKIIGLIRSKNVQNRIIKAYPDPKAREARVVALLYRFLRAYINRMIAHERWLKTPEAQQFLGLPAGQAAQAQAVTRLIELTNQSIEQARTRFSDLKITLVPFAKQELPQQEDFALLFGP